MGIDFSAFGPLFDGRLERAVQQGLQDAQEQVAEKGRDEVRSRLRQVLRHPTGYYSGHVQVVSGTDPRVTDGNVVYGPWLEGTGSRNRTTRFKGYRTFRLIRQRLQFEATVIARRVISNHIRRA